MEKKEKTSEKGISKIIIIISIVGIMIALTLGYMIYDILKKDNCMDDNCIIDYNETNVHILNRLYPPTVDKPIIYLYPEEETNVSVKLGNPENLEYTYPKYEDSWNVIAKPNGDLTDLKTGRSLYALYWEGKNTVESNMDEGFIVKGEDTISFLEKKLAILGLNERESNEFIIYWLPKLESNKYNFIRFQTNQEINKNMPLEITPKPDTIIRVTIEFKALENQIEVQEQKLTTPERKGFVAVEWGGTEIK